MRKQNERKGAKKKERGEMKGWWKGGEKETSDRERTKWEEKEIEYREGRKKKTKENE